MQQLPIRVFARAANDAAIHAGLVLVVSIYALDAQCDAACFEKRTRHGGVPVWEKRTVRNFVFYLRENAIASWVWLLHNAHATAG